ncbi:MAG: hypothetical protein WA100_03820, partial [Microgenomates group bacterium]
MNQTVTVRQRVKHRMLDPGHVVRPRVVVIKNVIVQGILENARTGVGGALARRMARNATKAEDVMQVQMILKSASVIA